jgi:hypothetical protein
MRLRYSIIETTTGQVVANLKHLEDAIGLRNRLAVHCYVFDNLREEKIKHAI